jgi:integrase
VTKLTAKRVSKALKHPGRYHDGHGLILQVKSPDNASWILRYERGGRERWHGLGPLHTVGLAEARERAKRARLQLLDGVDPVDAKRAAKAQRALEAAKAMSFRECAMAYIAQRETKWRNAVHRVQWSASLRAYVFPVIGELLVNTIDTGLVLKCIEPHWSAKTETMSRVRGRIEAILDWAQVRGYRSGENPARWRGHLEHLLPARTRLDVEHFAALPYAELPAFMIELRACQGAAARALEFLIHTAARSGEILGMQHNEVDLAEAVWTIPAIKVKNAREHRVALSKAAVNLLRGLPHEAGNSFVFIGSRPGSGLARNAMAKLLGRLRPGVSVHGFRSSFRDWAAERTAFPREVAELALAHRVGTEVERAYQRGDLLQKRFMLAEAWSKFASSPPVTKAGDAVVPMRAPR